MTHVSAVKTEIAFERASNAAPWRHECSNDADTALKGLYDAYYSRLLAYVTRILADQHHAEDVVQETMLRAWCHADPLTPDRGSVWGWLTRVAHNLAIDRIRARRARPVEVEVEETVEGATHGRNTDHSDTVINMMFVATMVNKLVPAHRSVLHAVYYADRTASDAASALGVPVGTVKSRLHHALRNLKQTLEHQR
ncbi:RNA polymerase sigma-70 factor, ECF subfamily [Saccharopolyspora shandongensis]|uniref:RNA polymerase sigma-70 factor, ECF subfamily n=1 Tax=Saccharopolyspora shandongensis TaxID=418495 RepID=A0A1H3Q0Z8_9PSEU|nr:sigma-70 family RNA polymerase sigma factor [Saccharopolyspora shandongensis]SDZ07224.1 RNA polymerase sigma-70 factor, ECF subfamily [Saccharopolyspora shandongensis]